MRATCRLISGSLARNSNENATDFLKGLNYIITNFELHLPLNNLILH